MKVSVPLSEVMGKIPRGLIGGCQDERCICYVDVDIDAKMMSRGMPR